MKKIFLIAIITVSQILVYSQAKKPSIMVVPSKQWCTENNLMVTYENQGVKDLIPDYSLAVLNSDFNNVATGIGGLMGERGFPLKDLDASMDALKAQSAEDAMLMSKDGGEMNESPIDKLKSVAKADIIIQAYWKVNKVGLNKSITFTLKAIDAYTNKQIAAATGTGNPSLTAELSVLLQEAVLDHIDNFNSALMDHFQDMFDNGREVALRVKTWDTWDYDLETEEFGDDELGILIEDWMSDNTVNGKFNTVDATESMMVFEQVRIPLFYERKGQQRALDTRRWAKGLVKYLKTFEIETKLMMKGLGQAQLVLGGK